MKWTHSLSAWTIAGGLLASGAVGAQSLIFEDGFELGSSAGWELSDEEILRELIDGPSPSSAEISTVLEVLAGRGGLPVLAQAGTFLFAADCGSTDLSIGGDFNGWTPVSMVHTGDLCSIELPIASPADSAYRFEDDGSWSADPLARRYLYDGSGELSLVRSDEAHLERWFGFGPSAGLAPRQLAVWVPEEALFDRVLYVHDGQELFDPGAITGGWQLQDSLPPEILAVGIHNTADRFAEYTPWTDDVGGGSVGGGADAYVDLVRHEIRAFVESRYGLAPIEGVMGSSLGGLVSLYIGQLHPDVFDFSASLSGTLGWGSIGPHNWTIIEEAQAVGHLGNRVYIDSGGSGTCFDGDADGIWDDDPAAEDNYCVNLQMSSVLQGLGYVLDDELWYHWESDAPHSPAAWGARVWRPLQHFDGL